MNASTIASPEYTNDPQSGSAIVRVEGNRKIYLNPDGTWYGYRDFYVGLGPTQTFYTLWSEYTPVPPRPGQWQHSHFHQNLAQDRNAAIAKALEITGMDLTEEVYDITTHGEKIERQARRANIFHFGRYTGHSIDAVYHGQHDNIPNKNGETYPGLGRKYVTFLAQSTWAPSNVAIRHNLEYIAARYGETEAEAGYFSISREWQRKAQDELETHPIPAHLIGQRVLIKGVVLGTKVVENDFGTSTKMLVWVEGGFKLWGSNCVGDRGDQIQFMARIEASKDDPCFGFFSRPTKPQLLQEAK